MNLSFIKTVMGAALLAMASACSSDEPPFSTDDPSQPDAGFDSRAFSAMITSEGNYTLTRDAITSYEKSSDTGNEWQEYEYAMLDGGEMPGPYMMWVTNGKIYTPMKMFSSAFGPSDFSKAWNILCKSGAIKDMPVMINRDYVIDGNGLSWGRTSLNAKSISEKGVVFTTLQEFCRGDISNKGYNLYVLNYVKGNPVAYDEVHTFDSVEEAYEYVIEAFRSRFKAGETDIRPFVSYTPDNPTFRISSVEDELALSPRGNSRVLNTP